MKQSFYAIGMLLLFVSAKAVAQHSETAFITRAENNGTVLSRPADDPSTTEKVNVPMMTTDKFKKDFKNVQDVEWTVITNGFRAYFLQDAVLTAVDYNRKGKLYSIIRYGKSVLPKDVLRSIEATFDEPVIVEASEVKMAGFASKVFVVVLEDKTSMKSIHVIDGQIEVINETSK